jgi:hypothetical protein
LQPAISFEKAGANGPLGRLDNVYAPPGSRITMEIRDGAAEHLSLEFEGGDSFRAVLSYSGAIQFTTQHIRLSAAGDGLAPRPSVRYRASAPATGGVIEIVGRGRTLGLHMDLPESGPGGVFSAEIPVTEIDLSKQADTGERRSTVIAPGTLEYPRLPRLAPVEIKPRDFVTLGRLRGFRVVEIAAQAGMPGVQVRLEGIAETVVTGSSAYPEDRRPSRLDVWYQEYPLRLVAGVLIWLMATALCLFSAGLVRPASSVPEEAGSSG